jgi:ATP-dependent Clp protease ATP-binding subunit ClpC
MFMPQLSPGVIVAWNIAALEAISGRHEFIEREHIMIGLAKTEEALADSGAEAIIAKIGSPDAIRDEVRRLSVCFSRHKTDLARLRRKLRHLLGTGPSQEQEPQVIHRSPACRDLFDLAADHLKPGQQFLTCMHLLVAVLSKPGVLVAQAIAFAGGDVEELKNGTLKELANLPNTGGTAAGPGRPAGLLEKYGTDLTQLALNEKIEPLIGRRNELLQLVRTLSRKTKNNPLLLGDPGVGKTALVRALARRIAEKKVPSSLQDKHIIEISLGALVAGTKYRGEFEERLTRIVDEVRNRPEVVLFIDEIHTMVSAGAAEGGLDAANLLKPALAGSDMRCIGSTTLDEYRKHFEKDAALARRFQVLMVDEPSPDEALKILSGVREYYEKHHGVHIAPSALRSAVDLGCRYILDRRLPDKALDLLDEACSRVKIGSVSFQSLGPNGPDHQNQQPDSAVTAETIAQVISERTGIPVARLTAAGQERLQKMSQILANRVIGQSEAVEKVTRIVTMARAGLRDPRKPIGVFLFVGPTGVGKTEMSKALADFLFGSENHLVRLDMSEYKEKHSISRLIGAPPGYIGHDEEGQLSSKLRRLPYSVVLLDEIEKAHPEICDLFLQLFDEGQLTDSHGRTVDGKNAIFIMTSNIPISGPVKAVGFAKPGNAAGKSLDLDARQSLAVDLEHAFRPEFLNRIDEVVLFRPLSLDSIYQIVAQMLARVARTVLDQGIHIDFSRSALDLIAKANFDPANGARPLARGIDRMVTGPLSQKIIAGEIRSGDHIETVAQDDIVIFVKSKLHEDASPGL